MGINLNMTYLLPNSSSFPHVQLWCVNLSWLSDAHQAGLSLPFLNRQEENKMKKLVGCDKGHQLPSKQT